MTFNIGSQTGGVINNVAGDQRITGGQHGTVVGVDAARQAVIDLRTALAEAELEPPAVTQAEAELGALEAELGADRPDPAVVAGPLERLTRLLVAAGPVASAAVPLLPPLKTLAMWLGAAGQPVLRLLPLLI
jgi:hypothetical protein